MGKPILLIQLALLTGFLFMPSAHAGWFFSSPSMDEVVGELAEECSHLYGELSRDVYVYHWGPKGNVTTSTAQKLPWDSSEAVDYVRRKTGWTYREDKNYNGMMGTSLYAAADPVVTSTAYGDTLVEIRLPPKARFLDTRRSCQISDGLKAKIRGLGCQTYAFQFMINRPNTDPCRKIVLRLLEVLHITFVPYSYSSYRVAGCPADAQAAFILVNPSLGKAKYVHVFSPKEDPAGDSGNTDRARVKAIYTSTLGSRNMYGAPVFWPKIDSSEFDVKTWAKDHIFGCDPGSHPEDGLDYTKKKLPALDFKAVTPDFFSNPPIGDEGVACPDSGNAAPDSVVKTIQSVQPVLDEIE